MPKTRILASRPHAKGKHQREGQRPDVRAYPPSGEPWGQKGWVPPTGFPVPTITTLTPATAAVGAVPVSVVIAGTNFTANVEVWHLGVKLATSNYVAAPRSITASIPTAGTAGTSTSIKVIQDGVESAGKLFAWTATAAFDPGEHTIDEVKVHVNGLPMDDQRDDLIQAILDMERANKNRGTLVSWLDQQTGVE